MRNDDVVKVGAAFLVGGAIGAAIALLYAPQSGRETRKDIKRTARRVKNEAVDLVEDTIDRVDDFVD
jgi:gas vesicle protein